MRTLAVLLIAAAAAVDEPTYGLTVQFDAVWGPSCIEAIEKGLGRLEGVVSAKAQGFRTPEKFYYDVRVKEGTSITPASLLAYQRKTLEDFDYVDMSYQGLTGLVEKTADGYVLTARSKQKFALKPGGGLEKLVADGKNPLTIAGKAGPPKGEPVIDVTEAVEAKK